MGLEGALAQSTRVPVAWGPDTQQRAGVRIDAGVRGARHGARSRARGGIQGTRLSGSEMVLPPRPDEWLRWYVQEHPTCAHAARNAWRRLRHHAGLLAVIRSGL